MSEEKDLTINRVLEVSGEDAEVLRLFEEAYEEYYRRNHLKQGHLADNASPRESGYNYAIDKLKEYLEQ